jgi:hypothetical protein
MNSPASPDFSDTKILTRAGIVYEAEGFYVREANKGFEVYKPSASGTHAERCAIIGYAGERGLEMAKAEVNRRVNLHRDSCLKKCQ